jgi:hypothetical protein
MAVPLLMAETEDLLGKDRIVVGIAYDLPIPEEILDLRRSGKEEIIIQEYELLAQVRNAPEHGLNRAAVEYGEIFLIAFEYVLVIHDFHRNFAVRKIPLDEFIQMRVLIISDNEYPADIRSEPQDGRDRIEDFVALHETGWACHIIQLIGTFESHVSCLLGLHGRIIAVHPSQNRIYHIQELFIEYFSFAPSSAAFSSNLDFFGKCRSNEALTISLYFRKLF